MNKKTAIISIIICSLLFVILCACADNSISDSTQSQEQTTDDQIVIEKPETKQKEKNNEDWKQAYSDYIEALGEREIYGESNVYTYYLINLDDNDIPELFITTESEAGGEIVATYYNNQVIDFQLTRIGSVYIERSGLILTNTGHMDYYPVTITELKDGKFSEIANGLSYWSDEDRAKYIKGETDEYILTYEWGNQEVSQEEFEKSINQIFDTNKSKHPENGYTLNEMINILSATK